MNQLEMKACEVKSACADCHSTRSNFKIKGHRVHLKFKDLYDKITVDWLILKMKPCGANAGLFVEIQQKCCL